MAHPDRLLSRREFLRVGTAAALGIVAAACSTPREPQQNALPISASVSPAAGEPGAQAIATATPQVITVEQALRNAAVNYAKKTNGNVEKLYRYITEIYNSLPADMPFVAPGTKGLIPHETQATNMPIAPSKNPNNPSFYGQASMRGFYNSSGGYFFAIIDDKYDLQKPWEDKTTQIVNFIGALDRNIRIGFYDYAAGGSYATGASYGVDQEDQFPGRRMIDKVWLADGIMQAALRDGPGGKTVVSFVDCTNGKVFEYTYHIPSTISGGNWESRTYTLPHK